jgi:hypothetical protein
MTSSRCTYFSGYHSEGSGWHSKAQVRWCALLITQFMPAGRPSWGQWSFASCRGKWWPVHHSKSSFYLTLFNQCSLSLSLSYITTDGQSASLSWNKAPVWGLRPDFYYCQTFACFLMWGALSDERTGLSFTIAPGPRRLSHFRVRVPWDSWPYFTVSDSRLPFSSPPTIRRVTVEVFDPQPMQCRKSSIYKVKQNLILLKLTLAYRDVNSIHFYQFVFVIWLWCPDL